MRMRRVNRIVWSCKKPDNLATRVVVVGLRFMYAMVMIASEVQDSGKTRLGDWGETSFRSLFLYSDEHLTNTEGLRLFYCSEIRTFVVK